MFLCLLFQLIRTQIFDCTITSAECSDNYQPVCGLTINMVSIQTFMNECYACKANLVVKYKNGECTNYQDEKTPSNHNDDKNQYTNSTFNPSGNYTQLFSCSDPRPSICGTNQKRTCGFLDSLTDCYGKYCQAQFINECHACRNTSIHNYFYGECSDYKQRQATKIQCISEQKNQCDIMEQIDVCGFLEETAVCQNRPCLQPFKNTCEPCNQSNIKSYFIGNCNDYDNLFFSTDQIEEVSEEQQKYKYCQPERPSSCNQEFSQTCGVLKSCNGTGCERIFDNPCSACQNTQIEGYYKGQCQTNFGYVFSIFVIQLLI
ncbi:unnamed protein product (macronuclear) [Paramecium tetraurelia]|uniref:Kazal-like domain-containing protein n=1 Tax=Paramecium tetraurelia TaxID=5888 RepID=A0DJX3_PARTE|nr:uncharacterized protein GSPATT00017684001 [Paramecium tetraurelia]CAK83340.1 unnamed protein product [Paramecium tetraurelia]|eukprot:XP_001450737.1 hypothetical protein (macronuclear) [Paramecium tetraurelia strain d4-2]